MKAPTPGRSTGTLHIGFGLVTVSCAVYAGVEVDANKISRHWRTNDGHEVGYITVDKETGAEVSRSEIYSVYTTEDGTEVPLNDEEIAAAMGEENGAAHVVGFYPAKQMREYVTENLLQVRPKSAKTKKNPFDKPFALLMRALAETNTFALVTFTLRGKAHLGTLDAEGNLRVVRWENEVREARPMPAAVEIPDSEFDMALALIEVMKSKRAPQMETEAVEKVRAFAEAKAEAMGKGETVTVTKPAETGDVNDTLAALQASIDAIKAARTDA